MSDFRLLLVDDEPHITQVLARKFELNGYRCTLATDGEEALEIATKQHFDLVVSDLQMPYMGGIEFAQSLRQMDGYVTTPFILLTARGYVLEPGEVASAKISMVLAKPFSAADLLTKVSTLLDSAAQKFEGPKGHAA